MDIIRGSNLTTFLLGAAVHLSSYHQTRGFVCLLGFDAVAVGRMLTTRFAFGAEKHTGAGSGSAVNTRRPAARCFNRLLWSAD